MVRAQPRCTCHRPHWRLSPSCRNHWRVQVGSSWTLQTVVTWPKKHWPSFSHYSSSIAVWCCMAQVFQKSSQKVVKQIVNQWKSVRNVALNFMRHHETLHCILTWQDENMSTPLGCTGCFYHLLSSIKQHVRTCFVFVGWCWLRWCALHGAFFKHAWSSDDPLAKVAMAHDSYVSYVRYDGFRKVS